MERHKKVQVGRAKKRHQYNKRYSAVVVGSRRKVGPNAQRK